MEREAEGARREELKGKCVGHSSKPHQIQIPVLTKACLEVVSLPRFFLTNQCWEHLYNLFLLAFQAVLQQYTLESWKNGELRLHFWIK